MFFKKIFSKSKAKIWNEGDKIQSFSLTTHTGSEFDYNSKTRSKLLLYFFPNAWSETSQEQILIMEKKYNSFLRFNVLPLCITTDTPASIKTWAKTISLRNIRLLSDFWPHGYLTNSFGILNRQRGCPERALILVDDNMVVQKKEVLDHATDFDVEEILSIIKNIDKKEE